MNMPKNESSEASVPVSFADFPPFLNPPISLAKQPSTEQKQIFLVNCIDIPCEDDQWSSEHQEYDECLDEEEALELINYKDTRKLSMLKNSSLSPEARGPTMKDLPELLKAHKLDERLQLQVVGQLLEANSVGGAAALSSAVPPSPPAPGSPPPAPPGPSQPPPGPGLGPSPKMKFIVSRDCKKAVCNRKRKYERMERRQQMRKRKCEQLEGGSVSNTIQEKGPATIRLAVRPSDATTVHTIENSTYSKFIQEFLDGHGKKKPRLADTSETRADSEDEPTDNTNKANPQPDERRDSFVQDNRCPICLELFVNVRILSCSHVFCETCIAKWMKKSKSCPMCKQTIEGKPVPCNTLDNDINELVKCFLPKEAQKERAELLKERAKVLEESVSPRRALVPYSDTSDSES